MGWNVICVIAVRVHVSVHVAYASMRVSIPPSTLEFKLRPVHTTLKGSLGAVFTLQQQVPHFFSPMMSSVQQMESVCVCMYV